MATKDKSKLDSSMNDTTWFKITNENECHHGFQYQDGLNVLKGPFNDDPNASCCAGGFYFSDITNIPKFFGYGCYLRELTLPLTDPEFKIIKDPSGDKWRANKLILGKRHDLWSIDTFNMLIERGVDLSTYNNFILQCAYLHGHFDIIILLVEKGYGVILYNEILRTASQQKHFETVKYIIEKGADIHTGSDIALRMAVVWGNLEMVKYLVTKGADIHACGDESFRTAVEMEHFEVVNFLDSLSKN